MPIFTPIDREKLKEPNDSLDRTLVFENSDEFWLLQVAAKARIKRQKSIDEEPLKVDTYIAGLPSSIPCMHGDSSWPGYCLDLLKFYCEDGYDEIPLMNAKKVEETRKRAAEFAKELHIANSVYEEMQEMELLWAAEAAMESGFFGND